MKNIFLLKYEDADVDNFTSDAGIKIRRLINPPIRYALKKATNGKITVEDYPQLEKDKPYIIAATHSFVEEISTTLSTIDRSAYTLVGTTDQFENNPRMYFNWITGVIFVNRYSEESRKSAVQKMERIINSGSSILLFPEGGFNNSENLLIQKLFAGPYILSKRTGVPVVPIATFNEYGSKNIFARASEPLELYKYDKKEALTMLRDALATLQYGMMEEHSTPIKRDELTGDPRLDFMEERKNEYLNAPWTHDVWDEELTVYEDRDMPSPEKVRESLDNVEITPDNAGIMAPILVKRKEDIKYNFNRYMHENWDK